MKILFSLVGTVFFILFLTSCAKNPCKELQERVCTAGEASKACEKAKGLTNKEECKGYLVDVAKFIEEAEREGAPAEESPAAEPSPAPTPEAAPAPATPPPTGGEQPAEAPAAPPSEDKPTE